jgi:uncharacterized protein YjbJ (UPF0337 family)
MDKDRVKGIAKDLKGSAKESWGKTTGDKGMERSGKKDADDGE